MTTDTITSSGLLKNVPRYEDQKTASSKTKEEMGKQDFLTLFTAQLQNQDPLEPVKNEAFVAQLAQFSQLEALTNMQGSLDKFVTSMAAERMLGGVSMIGKKVAVSDGTARLENADGVDASIDLPSGASGIRVQIFDAKGNPVQELIAGAQNPGTAKVNWDGTDALGNPAPAGMYRMVAQAVVDGKNTNVAVNTLATVKAITTNPTDGSVTLEVDGGKSILMTDVKRVGL
jgi:flagellar basal-body rod modification protein FlgD